MMYYMARRAALKWLETPTVYNIAKDELYELDNDSFLFLRNCVASEGCGSKSGPFIDYCLDEGILTTERVSLRRPALLQAPVPSLRYLELQITTACNLRCRHCYIGEAVRHELPAGRIRGILGEFEAMQGLRVMISGGEPLLHSEFDAINEMLPDFLLRKILFTNGLLLERKALQSLKVDEIQVSIDGLEAAHDLVRGAGTFGRSMKTVGLALDAGFDVSISTMVHRSNLQDFDEMEALFKNIGVKDWTVDVPCPTRRLQQHQELIVGPEEGGRFLGYGYGGGVHTSGEGYGCGLHLMAVTADGTMSKCAFYADQPTGPPGAALGSAWRNMQPVRLKDLACDCGYIEICRGGCRYRAELTEGKGGRDPYRCRLYGIR